jgi:hypothetical protein
MLNINLSNKFLILFYIKCFTILIFFSGCQFDKLESPSSLQTDTVDLSKYIESTIDHHTYPLLQRFSSQREPIEEFGLQMIFDGKLNTGWCSAPGLHIGEWIEFDFDSVWIEQMKITLSDTFWTANVTQIEVFINDSLHGIFYSNSNIQISKNVSRLRIQALNSDKGNQVELPVEPQRGKERLVAQTITNYYNSKSFGIAEVVLYDKNKKPIPISAIPIKNSYVSTNSSLSTLSLSDGKMNSGFDIKDYFEGIIFARFKDYTPITKIKLLNGINGNLSIDSMVLISQGNPDQYYKLKSGWNYLTLKEPMVSKFYHFRLIGKKSKALAEILFYDGARYYQLRNDSIAIQHQQWKDSMKISAFKPMIDNWISYKTRTITLTNDTILFDDIRNLPSKFIESEKLVEYTFVFRSNYTLNWKRKTTIINYQKNTSIRTEELNVEGFWNCIGNYSDARQLSITAQVMKRFLSEKSIGKWMKADVTQIATIDGQWLNVGDWGSVKFTY